MKGVLITVATLGILASTGWVVEANAQANIDPNVYPRHMGERYGARGPAYRTPAYGPSRRYARRAYRRSARQTFTPGSGPAPYAASTSSYAANSAQPYEWYAAPGPNRRGNMCITHVDSLRGYGFQSACPKK
jgi:hypothetical protein